MCNINLAHKSHIPNEKLTRNLLVHGISHLQFCYCSCCPFQNHFIHTQGPILLSILSPRRRCLLCFCHIPSACVHDLAPSLQPPLGLHISMISPISIPLHSTLCFLYKSSPYHRKQMPSSLPFRVSVIISYLSSSFQNKQIIEMLNYI